MATFLPVSNNVFKENFLSVSVGCTRDVRRRRPTISSNAKKLLLHATVLSNVLLPSLCLRQFLQFVFYSSKSSFYELFTRPSYLKLIRKFCDKIDSVRMITHHSYHLYKMHLILQIKTSTILGHFLRVLCFHLLLLTYAQRPPIVLSIGYNLISIENTNSEF